MQLFFGGGGLLFLVLKCKIIQVGVDLRLLFLHAKQVSGSGVSCV